ncbi:MAG TPA: hypothetical protein VHD59_01115 [Pseudolabrys sp.]|nr:hypothetical protein [Pseudolabrys sp.]
MGDQIPQGAARHDQFGGHAIHFDISAVCHKQPRIGVEHQHALRHVVQNVADLGIGRAQTMTLQMRDDAIIRIQADQTLEKILPGRFHFKQAGRSASKKSTERAPKAPKKIA